MDFLKQYLKVENNLEVSGLTDELTIQYIKNIYEETKENVIVVTNTLYESNKIYSNLINYLDNVYMFPMDDFLSSVIVAESPELKYKRIETLNILREGKRGIILTNLMGYLKYLPSKNVDNLIVINNNLNIKRDELLEKLVKLGYYRESLVTKTGEFAVRGFILDIYPIDEEKPIRIEFDGNIIDNIRYFDENTQISAGKIDNITIKAVDEIKTNDKSSLLDYCSNCYVAFIDNTQINSAYSKLIEEVLEYKNSKNITENIMYTFDELKPVNTMYFNRFCSGENDLNSKNIINYNSDFDKLKEDYAKFIKDGKEVIFVLENDKQIKTIKNVIPSAVIVKDRLNHGFIIDKYVVISAYDIENVKNEEIKYKNNYKIGKKIKDYKQLDIGDYVVHISHGIGIYKGITTLKVHGMLKDFLEIRYDGTDKIYVPVEKINSIYKYTEKDGRPPKVNKLGSVSWEKTKRYVASKIKDISRELIMLYQKRISVKSEKYQDFVEEEEFARQFKYELTKDQQKTITEISNDLRSSVPMDRLLCGDVGFGKTEVAMRAIFKTVVNNHQVMYLCPTTILSKQQYLVFKERFKEWPIEIELLNRHVTEKKAKDVIDRFKKGYIDILVGTHRILSDDIVPNDLGLLVIDEEQRFGVTHKEKIKKLKNNVNVLTLSATPIPRTLKMSMSGLRDLSIIDTPPVNRYPVQTYVVVENDLIIRDAIYKELSRNGQVFILYNYVESIEKYTQHISNLVPDARIKYAHGKMNKDELENIMADFVDYKYDILICTTIIESGIDIPNVNTLIIHDSDRFGLSQLYQIRGRVGRSNRIAYAYLMYDERKILNEIAIKRLESIKEFTELGSGYRIAMRDLSLRGAGDIFGANQAGFVDSVGVELYMKMIENEVKRLQGEEVIEEDESVSSLINVATHISDEYVSDEDIKIEIHQKINEINSYDSFQTIKSELEDRFGKLDKDLIVYMYEEWFEKIAEKHKINHVIQTDRYVEVELPEEVSKNIKGDKLLMEALALTKDFNLKYQNNRIKIILYYKNLPHHFIFYIVTLLEKIL